MRRSVAGFGATRDCRAVHDRSMRLAAVSDTHLPKFGKALPQALVDAIVAARIDLIVHLGDFTEPFVPALFEALGPFDAVAGNNDGPELVARFGRRKVLEIDGLRIGLTHGDLGLGSTTPQRARGVFASEAVAAVLFGHSHAPLVEIDGGAVRAQLRFFDDRSV